MSRWNKETESPKENPMPIEKPKDEAIKPTVILSHTDAYIYDRLKEAPKTIEEVKVTERDIPENNGHFLKLPKEVDDTMKRQGLTPRWVMKTPKAISHALDNRGWVIANRVYFKDLPDHLFSANGTIERGDLILMFMTEKRAKKLRELPGKLSNEKVKSLPIDAWKDGGDKYYKPKLDNEPDGVESTTGVQPDRVERE